MAKGEDMFRDLLRQIFSRLPVKDLCRLKLLGSSWREEIIAPYFIAFHLKNSAHYRFIAQSSNRCLSISGGNGRLLMKFIPFILKDLVDSSDLLLVCSKDGLVVLTSSCFQKIVICNPSTEDHTILPTYDLNIQNIKSYKHFGMAFGYDHLSESYKLVRVITHTNYVGGNISIVEIYSCRTQYWYHHEMDLPFVLNSFCDVIVEGFAFWTMPRDNVMVCFTMSTDTFESIELPEELKSDSQVYKAMELHNHLGLLSYECVRGLRNGQICLWTLRHDVWSKLFVIHVDYKYIVRGGLSGGHILLHRPSDHLFTLYDIGTKQYSKLGLDTASTRSILCYKETLVWIAGFMPRRA